MVSLSRILLQTVFLAVSLSLLVACTKDPVSRQPHAGPADKTLPETSANDFDLRASNVNMEQLKALYTDRYKINELIHNKSTTYDQLISTLARLKDFALNLNYVENTLINEDAEMMTAIDLYMRTLYRLLTDHSEKFLKTDNIAHLKTVMFSDCQDGLNECRNINIYGKAPMTATIMAYLAKLIAPDLERYKAELNALHEQLARRSSSDCQYQSAILSATLKCTEAKSRLDSLLHGKVDEYYFFLQAGYTTKGWQKNLDFDLMYVRYADLLFQRLDRLPRTTKNQGRYRQMRNLYSTSLGYISRYSNDSESRKEFCDQIITAAPYKANWSDLSERRKLRSLITEFIRCADERDGGLQKIIKPHLDQVSKDHLATWKAERKSLNEYAGSQIRDLSYDYALEVLKSSPSMMASLDIENMTSSGVEKFILEQVYYERIGFKTAERYWESIKDKIDDKAFLRFVRNFAKVQVGYLNRATLLNSRRLFIEEYEQIKGLRIDLFDNVANSIHSKMHDEWERIDIRLIFVKDFIEKLYLTKYKSSVTGADQETVDLFNNVVRELAQIKENLNYLINSPLMLAMNYYMSKADGSIQFKVKWWSGSDPSYSVDAENALSTFFDSDEAMPRRRLFKFGTERYVFNAIQKYYVLDMTLRGGLLDIFPMGLHRDSKDDLIFKGEALPPDLMGESDQSSATEWDNIKVILSDRDFDVAPNDSTFIINSVDFSTLNNEYLLFKGYIEDLFRNQRTSYQEKIKKLDDIIINGDFRDRFLAACENPLGAKVSIDVSSFYSGVVTKDKNLFEAIKKIYSDHGFISALRRKRDLSIQLLSIMKKHFYGEGAEKRLSPLKFKYRDYIVQQISNSFEKYKEMERNYFRKVFEMDRLVVDNARDCFLRLRKADYFQRDELINVNIDYYKDIHAAVMFLNLFETEAKAPTDKSLLLAKIDEWKSNSNNYHPVGPDGKPLSEAVRDQMKADIAARMVSLIEKLFESQLMPYLLQHSESTVKTKLALNYILGVHNISHAPFAKMGESDFNGLLGYYVRGVGGVDFNTFTNLRGIKRLNEISAGGLAQGKWDSFARIRSQLYSQWVNIEGANEFIGTNYTANMPGVVDGRILLGGNVDINLGSLAELTNGWSFRSNDNDYVPYDPNQESFVRKAMKQIAGQDESGDHYFAWYTPSGSGLENLSLRLGWLHDMNELETLELQKSDENHCPKDIWGEPLGVRALNGEFLPEYKTEDGTPNPYEKCLAVRVVASDIIDNYVNFGRLLALTPKERKILYWLHLESRNAPEVLRKFKYKNEDATSEWTWFDEIYRTKFTTVNVGGLFGVNERAIETFDGRYRFIQFKDTYLKRIDPLHALFKLSPYVKQIIRDYIREGMLRHLSRIEDVEESILDLEDAAPKNPVAQLGDIVFEKTTTVKEEEEKAGDILIENGETWRRIKVKNRKTGDRSGTPIYLTDDSDTSKGWFEGYVDEFFTDNEKGCQALPAPGDPDFKENRDLFIQSRKGSCSAYYKVYKDLKILEREKKRKKRREGSPLFNFGG